MGFLLFFILFCVGRLQGWKVDMEELENEQDQGAGCEIPPNH